LIFSTAATFPASVAAEAAAVAAEAAAAAASAVAVLAWASNAVDVFFLLFTALALDLPEEVAIAHTVC
jgi:hypothetical protein